MATKWGIVSAGKICSDFVTALSTLPPEEHKVVAVAARDLDRAKEFAETHNIPKAYGSYEELAKDPEVEIVYIGSINTEHNKLGKLFLNYSKHILCEKPLCMNKKEAQELINLAEKKNLFLLEAIWSRFNPIYRKVIDEIHSGTIGEVLQVQVNFGVKLEHKDRVTKKDLGGSVLLDIGVYCIQFATLILGKPEKIQATGHLNEQGVDDSIAAIFSYKDGKVAIISAHSRCSFVNEAKVIGTKGTIVVESPFWCPTSMKAADQAISIQLPDLNKKFYHVNSVLLKYEAEEVRRCLKEGLLESSGLTWQESLNIAEIQDEIRKQIGEVFDQDK